MLTARASVVMAPDRPIGAVQLHTPLAAVTRRKDSWLNVFVPSAAAPEDRRPGGVVGNSFDESVLDVHR